MLKYAVPLIVFIGLIILLGRGLGQDPTKLESTLINKPAPDFALPVLDPVRATTANTIKTADLKGKPWVINVFASWCFACIQEHKVITQLAQKPYINILGLNYKDPIADASQWLVRYGNPYNIIVSDLDGNTGIDYGVYGVPETFIMDHNGIIRAKIIGPVDEHKATTIIEPLMQQLSQESNAS